MANFFPKNKGNLNTKAAVKNAAVSTEAQNKTLKEEVQTTMTKPANTQTEVVTEAPAVATIKEAQVSETTPFNNLTREQFIAVELLKAGSDLAAVSQVLTSTPEDEVFLKTIIAKPITALVGAGVDTRAIKDSSSTVDGLIRDRAGKNDFQVAAEVVNSLGQPLTKVTLADLI